MGYLSAKDKNSLHEAIFFDVVITLGWIAAVTLCVMYFDENYAGLLSILFLGGLFLTLAYAGFLRPMVTGVIEKPAGPSLQFGKYIQPLSSEEDLAFLKKSRDDFNDVGNPAGWFQMMNGDPFHRDDENNNNHSTD